jgi:hypothetical protein
VRRTSTSRTEVFAARVLLAVLALLTAVVQEVRVRADDDMLGAWWIGRGAAASAGKPVSLGFAARFSFPFEVPSARLTLRADAEGEAFFDGVSLGRCGGRGAASPTEVWDLAGPLAAGPHEILVLVSHTEGVASLRAGLDAERIGRNCVVTDSAWRVDDDAKRIRERGFDGARYPATLFGTSPLSSWGISSSRVWRGRVAISKTAVSSRMP